MRRQDIQVFLSAFCLLSLETVIFHILQFTHDYLESTLVISYALLGLGLGSLAAHYYRPRREIDFPMMVLILIASIAGVFLIITRLPGIEWASTLIATPFLVGNLIITYLYRGGNANRLYYFDLLGATCGVFFCILFIPLLKAEGTLVLSVVVLTLAGLVFNEGGARFFVFRVAFGVIGVLSVMTMVANVQWHFLDLEKIARSQTKDYHRAISNGLDYLTSKDCLVARISIIADKTDTDSYRSYDGSLDNRVAHTYYNGTSNDVLDSATRYAFRNDPRIPFMYYADGVQHTLFPSRPEVLIIGSAAQGIVKSIKFLVVDPSRIDAVEINPAIVHLMTDELYTMSGEAYKGIDVH